MNTRLHVYFISLYSLSYGEISYIVIQVAELLDSENENTQSDYDANILPRTRGGSCHRAPAQVSEIKDGIIYTYCCIQLMNFVLHNFGLSDISTILLCHFSIRNS